MEKRGAGGGGRGTAGDGRRRGRRARAEPKAAGLSGGGPGGRPHRTAAGPRRGGGGHRQGGQWGHAPRDPGTAGPPLRAGAGGADGPRGDPALHGGARPHRLEHHEGAERHRGHGLPRFSG